jgi:hypothetical protein
MIAKTVHEIPHVHSFVSMRAPSLDALYGGSLLRSIMSNDFDLGLFCFIPSTASRSSLNDSLRTSLETFGGV